MTNSKNIAELPPIAIVAGEGALPRLLAEDCKRRNRKYHVVLFAGFLPDWAKEHPVIAAEFEKPGGLFKDLKLASCAQVVFAGGMKRPKINPLKFDWKFVKLAPSLLPALKSGDDATLRVINQIFEAENFKVIAAQDLLTELLAQEGLFTKAKPSQQDEEDANRASAIVQSLGAADVGQAAVVAQGVCLAVETIQGTDRMLDFVARTGAEFRADPEGAKGVLFKGPKPGQDLRVDLPAIGPETLRNAALAGLSGVVVQAGAVMVLGQEETVVTADELGLFFLARPEGDKPR